MKKIFIFALVIALVVGIFPAAAASDRYVTGMEDEIFRGAAYFDGRRRSHISGSRDLEDLLDIRPGSTIFMAFSYNDFIWGDSGYWPDMNMDFIRRHNVTVSCETHNEDGIRILESARIEEFNGFVGVMFRFADTAASVDAVEFSLKGSVDVRGSSGVISNGSAVFILGGTFLNRAVAVTRFSTVVKLGPGRRGVINTAPPASARYDIGAGVTITASLDWFEYQIYGAAREAPAPQSIRMTWPAVEKMITVETIGINNGRVSMSLDRTYYIYGPNMNFLGTSDSSLPQMRTYYLSRTRF